MYDQVEYSILKDRRIESLPSIRLHREYLVQRLPCNPGIAVINI